MLYSPNPALDAPLPGALPAPAGSVRAGLSAAWDPAFLRNHLWRPLAAFVIAALLLMGLHLDQSIADALYAMQGDAWRLKSGFLTQDILHEGGRRLVQGLWLATLLAWAASFTRPEWGRWRRPLAYLLLSVLLAAVVVGVLKRVTHMDCPWDLLRYGGSRELYGLFSRRPAGLDSAGCFPAGHAGAGFAWVAAYFFLRATAPRWRWWGLGFGLGLGLVFGFAQQLRGAHFLSHDLWALMLAWLTALLLYRLVLVGTAATAKAGVGL